MSAISYSENIGKKVSKCSITEQELNRKPFKSTFLKNTVKDVITHPILNVSAYTFIEDDSYVECRRCIVMNYAILFIGLPGSGKTTYIEKNIKGYKVVSADELKYSNPDYDPAHPDLIHQWSVIEAERLMNEYSDDGIGICMDSGGVNNSYSLRIINMLKSKGYHVELIYINTPLDVCLERNRMRERFVPEDIIIDKSERIEECVNKQKLAADTFRHIKYNENGYV